MSTPNNVEPYLFFNGRCEEALEFYRKAIGAEIAALMRFKDNPDKEDVPVSGDRVMHALFRVGDSMLMASDGNTDEPAEFRGFALTLNVATEAEAERFFAALAEGGAVHMPLAETFYSPRFGMVTDRFGVMWMILARARS